LREGLYEYDVLARVNDMNLADRAVVLKDDVLPHAAKAAALADAASEIGRYITLGPLGDALLPRRRPRVLLVDEIDKSDIDLPGDLLHVFERGWFEIPELVRERNSLVSVRRFGGAPDVLVRNGRVQCYQFPVILLTSNEEREFPPAFRRRCLHIDLEPPTESDLVTIARHKLDAEPDGELISTFVAKRGADGRRLATDQLLSALYLRLSSEGYTDDDLSRFQEIVLASLSDASLGD
jgi:MoxR-like ATPase